MNTSESASEAAHQSEPLRSAEATRKRDAIKMLLGKALDALFKAQEHLNAAADQQSSQSKIIDGINQSLRGLQREVSQVIYRV